MLAGIYRQPVIHLEFHQRHPWEWTTLAENRWTHIGRKLTGGTVHGSFGGRVSPPGDEESEST